MANVQTAFGLRPVRMLNGSPWDGQTIRCYCAATYAVALYIGDPVTFSPTLADKDPTGKYPSIILGAVTSGTVYRGVITSFEPDPNNLTLQYKPASTERWANVCVGADVVYQIRDDGSGTPTKVFPGQNTIGVAGTASTKTGLSGFQLDASTPTTTQAHCLHILGLADIPDNELDDYAVWEVLLNTCENTTGRFLGITAS